MSKSLAVHNGDLVLGAGRSFEIVTGKQKLFQDLTLWIYEQMGIDPSAPGLGTTFEGGFVNGQYVPPVIGSIDSPQVRFDIKRQISEVLRKYMQRQVQKIQQDMLIYNGRTTLDSGEVIKKVNSIDVTMPVPTQILVKVLLTTISNEAIQLSVPINI
jgi:hypothetical protein